MDDFRAPAPPGDVRVDGKTPGQDEKSVPLYVQALPVTEKLHGENSLGKAAALEKLSLAYSGLGDWIAKARCLSWNGPGRCAAICRGYTRPTPCAFAARCAIFGTGYRSEKLIMWRDRQEVGGLR